jgi:hypothetical protein
VSLNKPGGLGPTLNEEKVIATERESDVARSLDEYDIEQIMNHRIPADCESLSPQAKFLITAAYLLLAKKAQRPIVPDITIPASKVISR